MALSLTNTEIAFRAQSDSALRRSFWLFKALERPGLVRLATRAARLALRWHVPIDPIIRATIFRQFVGGETIAECRETIARLGKHKVGTILDYSVEGAHSEAALDATLAELSRTVDLAKGNPHIPFCVFKVSGVARAALIERRDSGEVLTGADQAEWDRARGRVAALCDRAHANGVRLFFDAEESWIQKTIDELATEMMAAYNKKRPLIFNTAQLYRTDRMAWLRAAHGDAIRGRYHLGIKLVRGAYMDKERARAAAKGTPPPIVADKAAADRQYDEAVKFCVERIDRIGVCAGTHNEASTQLLCELMKAAGLEKRDPRVWFSQLLGMSDHLSFNLAHEGYNVAKYVPYGPIRAVFPYLVRRAEENTSITGQTSRELLMIGTELKRRRSAPRLTKGA